LFFIATFGLLGEPLVPGLIWLTVLGNVTLAALLVLDYLWLRQAEPLTAHRFREEVFSLGVSNRVDLVVRNRGTIPLWVELADEPPADFRVDPPVGSQARNGVECRRTAARRLEPGGEWETGYYAIPPQRGDYRFGRLNVRCRTRLGLLVRQQRFEPEPAVRVYPNVLDLRKYELLGRRDQLAQMGLRQLRLRGTALEFESLREYVPGDELRRVDWKATARKGVMMVKEYELERSQQVMLALDLGRTMASRLGDLTKIDHAINACVLLSHVASYSDDRVGLLAFADEVVGYLPPGKGKHQTARLTEFLYPLHARTVEADYRTAFSYLGRQCRRRSLILVFTDLIDPDSSASLIAHLSPLAPRHLVLCVALSDYELDDLLGHPPQEPRDLYEQTVASSLQQDRAKALAALSSRGIRTLNAAPTDLSVAVVNRYLALKREGWL